MGLRIYLFGLYFAMFISMGLWFLLLFNVNPFTAPGWIIGIFYTTLLCFFTALFAIAGFYLKVWMSNREVIFAHLAPTLRQSALLATVLVGLFFLKQVSVLNWWVGILFIISLIMLELFFRSRK